MYTGVKKKHKYSIVVSIIYLIDRLYIVNVQQKQLIELLRYQYHQRAAHLKCLKDFLCATPALK